MKWFDRMITLRNLVLAKMFILAIAWLAIEGYFTFGDSPVMAQNAEDSTAQEVEESFQEGGPKKSDGRKSLLEGLLELPSISPDKISREELGRYLSLVERKEQQVQER